MNNQQKGTILTLLKIDESNRNYTNNYWFSYKDFLAPTDDFTDFSCEHLEGKQEYITLIEKLLSIDETAKIFVQVYGLEEDNNEQYITADTLIIFSKLSLYEIKQILMNRKIYFQAILEKRQIFRNPLFLLIIMVN